MKIIPSALIKKSIRFAAAALIVSAMQARAEDPSLQDLLREGLYAEEVTRDPEAAARQYEQVVTRHAEQNAIAATAIFRLAEVRRKQDRKAESIKLYQQLLTEFPQIEPQAKLARENLAAMGGKPPEPGAGVNDVETKEIARLREVARTSPDLAHTPDELNAAIKSNRPRVVKFLLESGIRTAGSMALVKAAELGHLEVLKLLITQSKEQLTNEGGQALAAASLAGHVEIVRALLAAGVDPNWQPAECGPPREPAGQPSWSLGTPLMNAIQKRNKELIDLLLESKADVKLPSNGTGFTALHLAAAANGPGLVEHLIDLGADVNALSTKPHEKTIRHSFRGPGRVVEVPQFQTISPLQFALDCNAWEGAKALIRHGANLQQTGLFDPFLNVSSDKEDLQRIKFLLDNGANPNVLCGSKTQVKEEPFPLLWYACNEDNPVELLKVLLAKGAKPGPALGLIVDRVAKLDEDGSLLKALLAFLPETVNLTGLPKMEEWKPAARRVFLDAVVIPALAKEAGTQMLFTNSGEWLNLTKTSTDSPILSTPALLLKYRDNLLYSRKDLTRTDQSGAHWPNIVLISLTPGGEWVRKEFDLTGTQPLPSLVQGDILEIKAQQTTSGEHETPGKYDHVDSLFNKLTWHLRKRISFPVTVEIAGKTRDILLRGDRLVFDPTLAEAPLLGAGRLMDVLWQPERCPEESNPRSNPNVVVVRKGWPEVKRPLSELIAKDFDLEAGDRVKLVDLPAEIPNNGNITLKAEGDIPFAYYFNIDIDTNENNPQLPTLIQALTHALAYKGIEKAPPNDASELLAFLVPRLGSYPQRLLPHPDLSRLRIRRAGEGEKVIEVNLEKSTAVPPEQMTAEQARQTDVELKLGDIIEVPIHQDRLKTPWQGFTQQEEAFFAKALNCKVSFTDEQGYITMKAIEYHQSRYVETAAGVIALPPDAGTASLAISSWAINLFRASEGRQHSMDLARGTVDRSAKRWPLTPGNLVFAREGDGIILAYQNVPGAPLTPGGTGGTRLPRPRLVPPAPIPSAPQIPSPQPVPSIPSN